MITLDHFKPPVGDRGGDAPRMAVFDHILRSGDDQHGHGQFFQGIFGDMGFMHHQTEQFRVGFGLFAPFFKKRDEVIPKDYGHLYPAFHPGGIEVGAVENQPFHKSGIFQSEEQSDVAAIGKTEDMGFFDAMLRHKIMKILRKLCQRKRHFSPGRLAVTPGIHGDDTVF